MTLSSPTRIGSDHAIFLDRVGLTTNRTPTPSLASMSINASVLNKSMRPQEVAHAGLHEKQIQCEHGAPSLTRNAP
jgi:hypothetical protein